MLDGVVQSAPAMQSAIPGGQVQITGSFALKEAKSLQTIFRIRRPAGHPDLLQEARTMRTHLDQEFLGQAVMAALVGMAIVIV